MLNIYVLILLGICYIYEGKHTCLLYNMLKSSESPLQFTVERSGNTCQHLPNHSFLDLYFLAATFVNIVLYFLTNEAKLSGK